MTLLLLEKKRGGGYLSLSLPSFRFSLVAQTIGSIHMGPPIALIIVIYFPFYPVSMCTKVLGVQGIAHVISGLKRPFLWLLVIFPFLAWPSYLPLREQFLRLVTGYIFFMLVYILLK